MHIAFRGLKEEGIALFQILYSVEIIFSRKEGESMNETMNNAILLQEIKDLFEDISYQAACEYEGCGADDGWPSVKPLI